MSHRGLVNTNQRLSQHHEMMTAYIPGAAGEAERERERERDLARDFYLKNPTPNGSRLH